MSKITVTMQFDTAEEAAAWLGGAKRESDMAEAQAQQVRHARQTESVAQSGQNTQQVASTAPATVQAAPQTAAISTLDDAKAAFLAAVKARGKPQPALEVLERVAGVKTVSAVDPTKFAELIAEFGKLAA